MRASPPATGVDLTPYVPRLALHWDRDRGPARHAAVDGTMVFADVSGFTRLSERLALAGGKLGAEQLTEVIDGLFDQLLGVAVGHGGEMLKYGGDAVLVLFRSDDHAHRAVAASLAMQRRLAEIGRVETSAGVVRMRMSVGVHTGAFDVFLVGSSHRELVVAGPAASRTIAVEATAQAGEVMVSSETAALLAGGVFGAERDGFVVVRRVPERATLAPVAVDDAGDAAGFVPVGLRDRLRAGAVEPEHRLVTQAFVHVSGLDDVLAEHGPEIAADRLDRTITAIQDACVRYGVTFLASDIAGNGTKAILVAGAPAAVEHPEARMMAALVAVVDGGCPLPVRAGVHCGHVFTGEVGPWFRRTYTTIGDVTNTAARVMARAAPGEVLTLAPLAEALRATHRFDELEPFLAKGKAEPLTPFRLAGEESGSGHPRERLTPFTGRDHELALAAEAVRAGAGGGATVVDVVGEAGLGKTRLLAELVDRVGLPARRLSCEPYETATPFFVIGHLLRAVLGPAATAGRPALARAVERVRPELGPWVPLLAEALDLDAADTPETARLDARYRRQRTSQVIAELLASAVDERTVLAFDDVHWADESSAAVLAHLEAERVARPWVIVLARRPTDAGHVPDGPAVTRIDLEPLDRDASAAFVVAASVDRPPPPHRVDRLIEHGAGNPLFLESLLGLDLTGEVEELPDSIEAIVASEIDRLPGDARRLLRLAAVHGASFTYDLLVATAQAEGIALPDDGGRWVVATTAGSLVRQRGARLAFRHHVLRDVAYASLPYRLRRRLHGHAADVLLAGGEVLDDRLGLLSIHEWHARRFDACWHHARLAGERAADKHAPAEAALAFRRALDAAAADAADIPGDDLAVVWERYGEAMAMTGDAGRASAAYKQARRLTGSAVTMGRLCFREARLAEVAGGRARARRWLRRGLSVVEPLDGRPAGRVLADLLVASAWTAAQDGRPDQALDLARRAVDAARRFGVPTAVADAYLVIDDVLIATGREGEATNTAAALDLFDAEGAVAEKASALNNLGVRCHNRGDWDEALRYYEQARDANLAAGNVTDAGFQAYNVAELLIDQGRLERAAALLDDLELLWRSVHFDIGLVFAGGLRGVLELRLGRFDRARVLLDDARAQLHASGLHGYALPFDVGAAEACLAVGDVVGAAEVVVEARRSARNSTAPGAESTLLRLQGLLAVRRGELSQGRGLLVAAVAAARGAGARYELLVGLTALRQTMHDRADAQPVDAEIEELRSLLDICADRVLGLVG